MNGVSVSTSSIVLHERRLGRTHSARVREIWERIQQILRGDDIKVDGTNLDIAGVVAVVK